MNDVVGKADVKIGGHKVSDVDVYAYHDSETNTNYRTVFISDLPVSPENGPKSVSIMYRGNTYSAEKYGNPNNQVPSYDFTVENKI